MLLLELVLILLFLLLMVLVPVTCGVLLRHRCPRYATRAERIGVAAAVVMVIAAVGSGVIVNGPTLSDRNLFPWKNAVAVVLAAPFGMLFAFAATRVWRCFCSVPFATTSTIVLETGVQNSVLALGIASLSASKAGFDVHANFRLQLIMISWGIFVTIEAGLVTLLLRWIASRNSDPTDRSIHGSATHVVEVVDYSERPKSAYL